MSRSSDAREGAALEGQADGVDGSDRASSRGFDDRSDVGVERRAPFAAKAVGYLSIDRAEVTVTVHILPFPLLQPCDIMVELGQVSIKCTVTVIP